jgi:hypothetical protein
MLAAARPGIRHQLGPVQTIFDYTGSTQTFTVPSGVTSLDIECWGAQGGYFSSSTANYGGYIRATVTVAPGEVLHVEVGGCLPGNLAGGYNGGSDGGRFSTPGCGGGGASDVRRGPGYALADRLIVAGGGGASATNPGAPGGAATGGHGIGGFFGSVGGGGGTQTAGGLGYANTPYPGGTSPWGSNGDLGYGGYGYGAGGGGIGAGGGGGGFYGGGGGDDQGATGGGGSNHTTGTATVNSQGVRADHGRVIIHY